LSNRRGSVTEVLRQGALWTSVTFVRLLPRRLFEGGRRRNMAGIRSGRGFRHPCGWGKPPGEGAEYVLDPIVLTTANVVMRLGRAVFAVVAAVGATCLVVAAVLASVYGSAAGSLQWVIFGPGPVYLTGLFAFWRRPDHAAARWLLAAGTMFSLSILAEYGF